MLSRLLVGKGSSRVSGMRNDLISLIFSNDDGSEVTMPATQLLEIASSLEGALSSIGLGLLPATSFSLEVAAADRGSFRLSFKWKTKEHAKDSTGLNVERASKLAQTGFHVVSTLSLVLIMSGYASWTQGKEPHAEDMKAQTVEARKLDGNAGVYDAAGKLIQAVIVVRADKVVLEVPDIPPVTIVGADTKYKGLLASKSQFPLNPELFHGPQGRGYPREISLRLGSDKMRAMVNGKETVLRSGTVDINGHTYKVIVIWNSSREVDDTALPDMPSYTVMATFHASLENIEPIDPVNGSFRSAAGFAVVEGVKTFE